MSFEITYPRRPGVSEARLRGLSSPLLASALRSLIWRSLEVAREEKRRARRRSEFLCLRYSGLAHLVPCGACRLAAEKRGDEAFCEKHRPQSDEEPGFRSARCGHCGKEL